MQYPPVKPCPAGTHCPPVPQSASRAQGCPAIVAAQTPPWQNCPAPHRNPQMPQFAVWLWRFASQPLTASRSQSAKFGLHSPMHRPPEQKTRVLATIEQVFPHPPQLDALVFRLVSQPLAAEPSQSPKPGLHAWMPHAPEAHRAVALVEVQRAPHAPQWLGSDRVSTHTPPHRVSPLGHRQTPAWHVWPPVQAAPQAPQFAASVRGLTQRSSAGQYVCPATGHTQRPLWQTCEAGQRTPQPPQWFASVTVERSQPLSVLPSQFAKPGRQALSTHTPAVQDDCALGGVQARMQPPQWANAEPVFTSHPLAAFSSQLPMPGLHVIWHAPPTQAAVPPAALHALPQAPQCIVAELVSVSQEPLMSQSAIEPEQRSPMHTPLTHSATRPGAAGQTRLHAPQCEGSRSGLTQRFSHAISPGRHATQRPPVQTA